MIELHVAQTGQSVWYNPALIGQVFEIDGQTYVWTTGTGTYVLESVEEVLALIAG